MDSVLLSVGLVLVAGAVIVLVVYSSMQKQVRAITRPTARIGDARAGPVTLAGRVGGKGLQTSPISEKPCVYMQLSLTERGTPLSQGEWLYRRGQRMYVPGPSTDGRTEIIRHADRVWIEDDSGRVGLVLEEADFALVVDQTFKSSALAPGDPKTELVLRRFGAHASDANRQGSYTLRETILEPGDEILVSGQLAADGSGHMVVRGSKEEPMAITDRDAKEITRELRSKARWSLVGGLLLLALGALVGILAVLEGPEETEAPSRMEKFEKW